MEPSKWREMLSYLRRHHSDVTRQWFEELEPWSLQSGLLTVRTTTSVQKNYLSKHCAHAFNDAAQAITGNLVVVQFTDEEPAAAHAPRLTKTEPSPQVVIPHESHNTVRQAASPLNAAASNGSPASPAPPRPTVNGSPPPRPVSSQWQGFEDEIVLSPDYTFDHFIMGPGNRLAFAAAQAVADQPGRAYNPLFIHGGVGLGKTHLLQGICQKILERDPSCHIIYLSCDSFVNQFMECVSSGSMHEFRHRYRHADMLIIDDIHFLTKLDLSQEEFFHTFNTLYQANKQIVLSSDSPPEKIPELEERLVSRFNWGLVAMIDQPCYETRVAIVRKKAALRGEQVPDDVICYIASKIESNTRELEGALTKVISTARLTDAPLDLNSAQQALGDEQIRTPTAQLTVQDVFDVVTRFYSLKLAELTSKKRARSVTIPRQVGMYLARKFTEMSLEEIGGYFGGRDHTTVMHAARCIEQRIETDTNLAAQVNELSSRLQNNSN